MVIVAAGRLVVARPALVAALGTTRLGRMIVATATGVIAITTVTDVTLATVLAALTGKSAKQNQMWYSFIDKTFSDRDRDVKDDRDRDDRDRRENGTNGDDRKGTLDY